MPPPRGPEFWLPIVQQVLDGDTICAVAARHKVSKSAVGYWCKKARNAASSPSFLPVRVASRPASAPSPTAIEMRAEGVRLRFAVGTDPAYLASLLAALRAC